jgi:cellulose synthase/poly-beta-1,6-N-acetylglucosamine synthase-like glycosyltransferase
LPAYPGLSPIIRSRHGVVCRTFVGHRHYLVRAFGFLACLGSLVWLALSFRWLRGIRKIPVLEDVPETDLVDRNPALSIILAARDEERSVNESVVSMLAQDYSGMLEVIGVNDRSTDRTAEILEELVAKHPDRLRVSNVDSLPEGWLGKTHALHTGAARATGEWLLFTDADVIFSTDSAEKAVRYAISSGLDHLTLPPEIVCRSVLLRSFVAAFILVFEMTQRPWRVGDPRTQEHVGVGAFNLIRKDAYERSGTHRAIRMRPDDDMKLAKLLKRHGFRQGVAYGAGLISVEWHQTLPDAVQGLSKSMFSSLDYRIGATVAGVLMLLLTNVLPVFGLFARNLTGILCRLNFLSTFLLYAYRARHFGNKTPWWYAVLHPFGICVFIYAMLRSASTTLAGGGIEWRETRYSLKELKDNAI